MTVEQCHHVIGDKWCGACHRLAVGVHKESIKILRRKSKSIEDTLATTQSANRSLDRAASAAWRYFSHCERTTLTGGEGVTNIRMALKKEAKDALRGVYG